MGAKNARKKRRCRHKASYNNAKDARSAMFGMIRRKGINKGRLTVYKCDICGKWHYGKRKRWGDKDYV